MSKKQNNKPSGGPPAKVGSSQKTSSNNSKSDFIIIHDIPYRIDTGFSSLDAVVDGLKNGTIISEVGSPTVRSVPFYSKPIPLFVMRAPKTPKVPEHIFGRISMGSCLAGFIPILNTLPAVGTTVTIHPAATPLQNTIFGLARYIQADAIYIFHFPMPINAAPYVELFCPELQETVQTRGIKFKPIDHQTVAVLVPWNSDIRMVPRTTPRPGQSGLSINLRLISDNTTEAVVQPLQYVVYKALVNVELTGLTGSRAIVAQPYLNFEPVSTLVNNEHEKFFEDFDDIPEYQSDEGKENTVSVEIPTDLQEQTQETAPDLEITTPAEKPTKEAKPPKGKKSVKGTNLQVNAKWMDFQLLELSPNSTLEYSDVSFNPANFTSYGDNIALAHHRNVWVTGSEHSGYSHTNAFLLNTHRSATVAGLLEVQESRNPLSHIHLCEFGSALTFTTVPHHFDSTVTESRPRYYNSPWLRTDEAQTSFRYRPICINRGVDVPGTEIRVQVKGGESSFSVPIKPQKNVPTFATALIESMITFIDNLSDTPEYQSDDSEYIAPSGGAHGSEFGEVITDGFDDDIENDYFKVENFNGMIPVNQIVAIPMVLPAITDVSGDGDTNIIREKISRFAQLYPTGEGELGPEMGSATVIARLPTNTTAQIEGVSLPGDMNDIAALRIFGFGSLLSIATSFLNGIGGPALSGLVQTGIDTVSNILGLGNTQPEQSNSSSAQPVGINFPIPVSRYPDFVLPVPENESADPIFGSILMKIRDVLNTVGEAPTEIPISMFTNMLKTKFARATFDRRIPTTNFVNEIRVPVDRIPSMLQIMLSYPETQMAGTQQYNNFQKLFTFVRRSVTYRNQSFSVKEILEYPVTNGDELNNIRLLKSREKLFSRLT